MKIFALDPGTTQSALVRMENDGSIEGHIYHNPDLLIALHSPLFVGVSPAHLVIEEIECMGMAVGKETFATVFWAGRFAEAWEARGLTWSMLPRRAVKLALCGSMKAKDTNLRQALIDRYGGSLCVKKGGKLAGIKSHLWAALAIAETYREQHRGLLERTGS